MRLAVAILLPWLVFFTIRRPIAGVVCLLLQLTILGWIPAALWAVYALGQYKTDRKIADAIGEPAAPSPAPVETVPSWTDADRPVPEAYELLAPDRATTTLIIIAAGVFLFHLWLGAWAATHFIPPRIGSVLVPCYRAAPLTAWLLVAVAVASYFGYLHEQRGAAPRR